MQLRYLEISNFLSHEHEEQSFPDQGIFLLEGESGVGKSSFIIDAIGYVLFGPVAARAKQDELRNADAPGEPMSVRARFDFEDGTELVLARGVDSRGSGWATASEPDPQDPTKAVVLEQGAKAVGQLVRKRLGGMTWFQFYSAFVARQSQITQLTSLKGADRKTLVHEMLGMREIKKGTDQTSKRLRSARVQLDSLTLAVGETSLLEQEKQTEELASQLEMAKTSLASAERDLENLTKARDALANKEKPLREKQEALSRLEQLQAQKQGLAMTLDAQKEKAKRHAEASKRQAEGEALRKEHQEVKQNIEALRADYVRSTQIAKASKLYEEALGKIIKPKTSMTLVDIQARIQILGLESKRILEEISVKQQEKAKLEESGLCYTCLRPMDGHEHENVMENVAKVIDEMISKQKAAEKEKALLETELPLIKSFEADTRETETIGKNIEALKAEGDWTDDLAALGAKGKALASKEAELSDKLGQMTALLRDLDPQIQTKLEASVKRFEEIETQEKELSLLSKDFDAKELKDIQERLQAHIVAVSEESGRVPEMRKTLQRLFAEHQSQSKALEAFKDKAGNLEKIRSQVLQLEQMQTFLKGFQQKLAREIRPALEEIGSEMLNQISGGRHTAMKIDDNYEIEVETETGNWMKASLLSGGEEVRANVCLRLALTRLVSQRTGVPVGFLVFDEPLHSQDSGHIERIMELLESLKPFYPQMFLISHVGDLASSGYLDYIIRFSRGGIGQRTVLEAQS